MGVTETVIAGVVIAWYVAIRFVMDVAAMVETLVIRHRINKRERAEQRAVAEIRQEMRLSRIYGPPPYGPNGRLYNTDMQ